MATLILSSVGTALGGPLGGAIGGIIGGFIDRLAVNALTPGTSTHSEGSRVNEIHLSGSSEGATVKRSYGRVRMGGNIIWATQFKEVVNTTTTNTGGKGGPTNTNTATTYSYFISFAIAFCEGNSKCQLGRVWTNGKEFDMSKVVYRFYPGSETQLPDSLIQSIEGVNNTPAYRGICYLVFENLPIEQFGNGLPQITAEIFKPVITSDPDDISNSLKAVTMIPASGEFIYGTTEFKKATGAGNSNTTTENLHTTLGKTDFVVSMDQLQNSSLNAVNAVELVVSWFGDDLRAGNCKITPKVESQAKVVTPTDWIVTGINRAGALAVSVDALGKPVFGGTPSDNTVVQAIQNINGRGLRCVFYPFFMMDIKTGNALPDPYLGTEQAPYPWRGRVTCSPAPGKAGTVDKTATAGTQVDAFFGAATAAQFTVSGTAVSYTGPGTEKGYRRMILHYAKLCIAAGGVNAFLIGSELVGLTQVRSSAGAGTFPAVNQLVTLAADVKALFVAAGMSSTKVGYAADWSEYHSYRPVDGTSDVIFNMDPLWSSANIDFIGIDNYLPISDWRDTGPNADYNASTGPLSVYDKNYLKGNIEAGEYFAWYYATQADRTNQVRTAITDGTYSKPWVFRQKDIRNWWLNSHFNRPAGVEAGSPTAWTGQSKPIWFTEFGCPSVDKAPNQPNVFYDPKSVESAFPYFSNGKKDDTIQRLYLESVLSYWRDNSPTAGGGFKMVDPLNMFAWTWDARPYPDFPGKSSVWSDAPNWEYGHWLNGRINQIPLWILIKELCNIVGITAIDITALYGANVLVKGYVIDSIVSVRDMINTLTDAYQFDGFESEGLIKFALRANTKITALDSNDFAITSDEQIGLSLTRGQETDLPRTVKMTFIDEFNDYNDASIDSSRAIGKSQNVASYSIACVLDQSYARGLADTIIQFAWVEREKGEALFPPSKIKFDPSDGVSISWGSRIYNGRIRQIDTGQHRKVEFTGFDTSLFNAGNIPQERKVGQFNESYGSTIIEYMDLPLVTGAEPLPWAPRIAAYQNPWPGGVSVYKSNGSGYTYNSGVSQFSGMGELQSPLYSGPVDRWDDGNSAWIQFYSNVGLLSITDARVFAGENVLAIKNAVTNEWEILQFATAVLNATNQYTVSRLLRGQLGSEGAMLNPFPIGSRVVFINTALLGILNISADLRNIAQVLRSGPSVYDVANTVYQEGSFTFKGIGLRPYSVSNIKGRKVGTDVLFDWKRRTRFGGDSWDQAEVPLNEESEKYDIEIMNGAVVVRTATVTTNSYTYLAADQVTDFGSAQSSYTIRVYQISGIYGRGQVNSTQVFL